MEKIKIENLTFKYPAQKKYALDNINITINSGEFVCICGKSGCGKSTLLRQLKPILSPHGEKCGAIYFDGQDISKLSQRQQAENIGFVMQNPDNQIVCDKVWHELSFGLESLSYSNVEIRALVAEMASFFGIQDWYYKDVAELSGGQKQLLNLASVMVMQPSILILDEPTSQLDPIAAHDFLDTISKINKELGTTIILSEHRLEEALPLSDRMIVMDNGKIIADGDVKSVGKILKDTNNDMLLALPTPMRICYSTENNFDTPITVRDGRHWLSKMPINKETEFKKNKSNLNVKPILKIKDIWFRYEKEAPDILKGLSLEIFENQLYAIVGGNGAGKSTLLSAIMNINSPYRGKVEISDGKSICALPQNPQSLFVKNTVLLELWEMAEKMNGTKEEKEKKIQDVIRICELENLIQSHPYDLSGGEAQRTALAKVLLYEPDILLLDEPTKGLDAHFKKKLAKILNGLKKSGVTIIMVSHDVEFCAKYADRLGMFFDGNIVSEDEPRAFFAGKSFYTTSANRMARFIRKDAVLDEDIIKMLGKNEYIDDDDTDDATIDFDLSNKNTEPIDITPIKETAKLEIKIPKSNNKLKKRTIFSALMILLLIPFTIYIGVSYFDERKYYFISLLIILETLIPFVLVFEGRKPQARELVIISVICAIAVAGRVAFAFLPQFKPVVALVIITGVCFGAESGFLVGALTAFISNFYFTQGPWTPYQMFAFGIIGFLSGILFQKGILRKNKLELCIFGFFATLIICGIVLNISSIIMVEDKITTAMMLSAIIAGLPLDFIHAVSTVFFLWFALEPMCKKLERIKIKYGLIE